MAPVAQPRLRVLLGLLGVTGGPVVTAEALVDGLWGEEWSPGRERNLHALVYQLRRRLAALEPDKGGARLARAGAGYQLTVGPGELDVAVFRDLAGRGREAARAGDAAGARELLGQALGLWRGAALADAAPLCRRLAGEAARLEEARLALTEERIGCDLVLGRHGEVAGELAGLVAEFPLRERLAALLMTALYRCGRPGEALAAFEAARRVLAGELGLDPGPELGGLQAQVLADDPALAAPAAVPGGAVSAAAEGAAAMGLPQGTVTFLFTDLEGSTRRWEAHPQEMRDALARHDVIVRGAVESHGGVVLSTMGDGMAAVFASARDAARAVLAAQQGLAAEDWAEVTGPLAARMGLLTDEGVLGGEHYLNQPLNRCARLMAAGHGGQALVSGATELLVREDLPNGCALVDLGEHRLRDLARPVTIFQLTGPGLRDQFPPLRTLEGFAGNLPIELSSFVGRAGELGQLAAAMARSPLVTVTGPGGVGKTRLALHAAADQLLSFRDGAWLCELHAAGDEQTMAQAVLAALRVRPRTGLSTAGSVLEFLRTRTALLLVLDNCEHLAAAAAVLAADILRGCPGVRVLATSQQPLGVGGEQVCGRCRCRPRTRAWRPPGPVTRSSRPASAPPRPSGSSPPWPASPSHRPVPSAAGPKPAPLRSARARPSCADWSSPSAAVALADALRISLAQLAGQVTYDLDLAGEWWCAWQTWKDGQPRIDVHPLEVHQRGELLQLDADRAVPVAEGSYRWRGELRLWDNEALIGWCRSTDAAVRSKGALYLALHQHGTYAWGRWMGMSYDGAVITGWGAMARSEDQATKVVQDLIDSESS